MSEPEGEPLPYIWGRVGIKPVKILIDTGASCTLVREDHLSVEDRRGILPTFRTITGVTGDLLEVVGEGEVNLVINGRKVKYHSIIVRNMKQSVIVGYDLLSDEGFTLDFTQRRRTTPRKQEKSSLRLRQEVNIPAQSYHVAEIKPNKRLDECLEARVQAEKLIDRGVWVMDSVATIREDGGILVCVVNENPYDITLKKRTRLATVKSYRGCRVNEVRVSDWLSSEGIRGDTVTNVNSHGGGTQLGSGDKKTSRSNLAGIRYPTRDRSTEGSNTTCSI